MARKSLYKLHAKEIHFEQPPVSVFQKWRRF